MNVMSHLSMLRTFWKILLKSKMLYLIMSEQDFSCSPLNTPLNTITVCRYSVSLMMPNSDLWDSFSYPTITIMMDHHIISQGDPNKKIKTCCSTDKIFIVRRSSWDSPLYILRGSETNKQHHLITHSFIM